MQVVVNGLVTNVQRYGSGRRLLILHGWGDDGRSWRGFAEALAGQYEVIVPDLPGFGGTEAPHDAWGLDGYASFVSALIGKVDFDPFAVIGHSNGGAIAIHGIAAGKIAPKKLVLLASAGIRGENKGRNAAWSIVAKAGKVATVPLPAAAKQRLRRKLYKTAGSDMLFAEHLQETFRRVVGQDVREDAAKLQLPTLLVYGVEDTSTPPQYGEKLAAAIPGSRLELLPGVGHFVHVDAQAEALRLVKEFLK